MKPNQNPNTRTPDIPCDPDLPTRSLDNLLDQFLDEAANSTFEPRSTLDDRIRRIAWKPPNSKLKETVDRFSIPRVIGQYRILECIGSGGMGNVYRAKHSTLQRDVALKTLSSGRALSTQSSERFHREMRALASLNHPNIVSAYDGDVENDVAYLVMEFVDGVNLHQLSAKSLTVPVCCELIRQAALGLAALHEVGILHRDIKPSNLMLTKDGTVKLVDLGLARIEEDRSELTSTLDIIGTENYISPEQFQGLKEIDTRTDIFGLGRTLQVLLSKNNCSLPTRLQKLVAQMVADRDHRLSSATEVAQQLELFCETTDLKLLWNSTAQPSRGLINGSKSKPSRSFSPRDIILVVFCMALLPVGILAWSNFKSEPKKESPDSKVVPQSVETEYNKVRETERSRAAWVLQNGGLVTVNWIEGDAWSGKTVTDRNELPQKELVTQVVEFQDKNLSPADIETLGRFENLEGINLYHLGIDDRTPLNFNPDWNLKWLSLPSAAISDKGVQALAPFRNSLVYLDVSNSQATDESIAFLSDFAALRGLKLGHTKITNTGLAHMSKFPSLVLLDLSGTRITSAGVTHLAKCPKLGRLILDDLPLTDDDLRLLIPLPLTELQLKGTKITNRVVEEIRNAHPDCTITH